MNIPLRNFANITGYLKILDETGEETNRISGALNKDELIKFLKGKQ